MERCMAHGGHLLLLAALGCLNADAARADEAAAAEAPAETFVRPYDGIQAGKDAHAYWEARRRDAINRQLGWNEFYKYRAAWDRPYTIYYDPYVPGGYLHGDVAPWGPLALWDGASPWPYARGRIIGYGFYDTVPQPIGQRHIQTGPNRWESHPVYADDVFPKDVLPKEVPAAVGPARPAAPPEALPPPDPPKRTREF